MEFTSACVVGPGRVGTAFAARLAESLPTRLTGHELETGDADLVVLCVPDRAVAEVAAAIPPGPWLTHTSGARTLDALDPHVRRFGLHPLQTFVRDRGAEQLDGAWAAVSGEDERGARGGLPARGAAAPAAVRARRRGARALPRRGGDGAGVPGRAPLGRGRAHGAGGRPARSAVPLMRRTMENDFELTGPATRGDWETIERHLEVIREHRPELEPMYRALTE